MTAFARLAQIAADPAPCLTARQIIETHGGVERFSAVGKHGEME